jgi:uncharacterized protein YcbX
MRVAALHTYPVKGCHRVDHDRAYVQPWGFTGDRRWLIIDEDGVAITQRDMPGLTAFFPRVIDRGLLLRMAGREDLAVAEPHDGRLAAVSVWDWRGKAALAGSDADAWLSSAFDRKLRLVWLHDTGQRAVEPESARPGDTMGFQDEFPVSLANLGSLAALNDLIAESGSAEGPLPVTRFRPNIVLADAPAWIEDSWNGGRIRVGEVTFRVARGCGRCVVTTTDQETGERGHEPLVSLGRHRNLDRRLLFSAHLIPDGSGTVRVGDAVEPA